MYGIVGVEEKNGAPQRGRFPGAIGSNDQLLGTKVEFCVTETSKSFIPKDTIVVSGSFSMAVEPEEKLTKSVSRGHPT